jgi:hypothetical protein
MKKTYFFLSFICGAIVASAQITWSPSVNVASSSYSNLHPRVVTNRAGDPIVIWGRSSDESVFISRLTGTTFSMPMKVNPSGMTIATASWMGPDIAAKGDTVYVVMKETPEMYDTNYTYISRSVNAGLSFSAPVRVDNIADSVSRFPVVTTDALGNPIVGFMKFDAAFGDARWVVSKSTDFGNTFSTDKKASGWSGSGALVCDCCPGSIVCSGSKVAMLYRDNLSNIRDMWGGISSNTGSTFTQGLGFDQGNWMLMSCPSSGPDGTIIGDTLYTTYMSGATGDELVYTNRSSLSSLANSAGAAVTGQFTGLTQQNYPRIASAGTAIATVWRQSVSGMDYLISRFSNNVNTGTYDMDTIAGSGVTNADVTMVNGKIFVVWQDYNSGTVKYRMGTFATTTGISESRDALSFRIYPNPATSHLNIQLPQELQAQDLKLTLTSVLGKEVLSQKLDPSQTDISLKELPAGVYFIRVDSGNRSSTQKIVINR